jgi:hypothetical protein
MTTDKPQQQTLSVRIDETLRRRLERARQLSAVKTGEPASTSEIAKRFLEAARDDRLEVVDLLADPTGSLLQMRRKGDAGLVLTRAEWTTLAYFVRAGTESVSAQTPHAVSRLSLVAVLDAFLAVYDLRTAPHASLDTFYLGNLVAIDAQDGAHARGKPVTPQAVRRGAADVRRELEDPAVNSVPLLLGRNLYVLLDEDRVPGAEALTRALRPFWPALWRLAARGHYVLTGRPVREPVTVRDGLYRPPIPSLTEGGFSLAFARGEGSEFSLLLGFPGVRGPRYPIIGYPRIAEFRTMVTDLVADPEPGDWTGLFFYAQITSPTDTDVSEIWFRAHDNGVSLGLTAADEWRTVDRLLRRAWEVPDIRAAWDSLSREYGEL